MCLQLEKDCNGVFDLLVVEGLAGRAKPRPSRNQIKMGQIWRLIHFWEKKCCGSVENVFDSQLGAWMVQDQLTPQNRPRGSPTAARLWGCV
jgi:hypothetical protein